MERRRKVPVVPETRSESLFVSGPEPRARDVPVRVRRSRPLEEGLVGSGSYTAWSSRRTNRTSRHQTHETSTLCPRRTREKGRYNGWTRGPSAHRCVNRLAP